MAHVRNAFLFSAPLALLVIAFGSWIIASRAISPICKLTSATRGLSAKNLNDRIEEGSEDREFSELIQVFNDMLERLERSFNQATRFSADAAHELKTPLTILQGHLESALQEAPDDSEQQRRLGMLLEETQRLHGITRRLLLLAQADAGQIKVKGESIRIRDLLAEMVEDFEMQAPQTRYTLSKGEEVTVSLDRSLVTQILQNLLSNAVKYNDETDPWVKIDYEIVGSELKIDINNGGDGIPESAQARLFERFSRVDSARNRGVDGFGLGLNLSREFARAQGGELSLAESSPGMTRFRLTLPIDS
jgi:signal transduction histidine kinase